MSIQYHSDSLEFSLKNSEAVSQWLLNVFVQETDLLTIELNIVFCSDEELLEVNKDFLQHDFYTDIITFPIEQTDEALEAELYISVDRVKDNAQIQKVDFDHELNRVMVHGVLHLCGYGDKSNEEAKIMRSKEDGYLKIIE